MTIQTKRMRGLLVLAMFGGASVLGSTWAPRLARACMGAEQHRLIPLGTAQQGRGKPTRLVLLQLKQNRFGMFRGPLSWKVSAWLRFANTAGKFVGKPISVKGLPTVRDARYTTDILPLVKRALARARKLPKFKRFGRPKLHYCLKAGRRCGPWRPLASRLGRFRLAHRLLGKRARFVNVANIGWYAETASSFGGEFSPDESKTKHQMLRSIGIHYAMSHRWDKLTVWVLNVSSKYGISTADKGWTPKKCKSVATCIPPEPDGDHSVGMDVLLIWQPTRKGQPPARSALPKPKPIGGEN